MSGEERLPEPPSEEGGRSTELVSILLPLSRILVENLAGELEQDELEIKTREGFLEKFCQVGVRFISSPSRELQTFGQMNTIMKISNESVRCASTLPWVEKVFYVTFQIDFLWEMYQAGEVKVPLV